MIPERPLLRYLGSKWRLAPEIVRRFPPHGLYLEPFGGSAAVLAHKPRCNSEIWNDLDGEVVNLFQVLRSADASRLAELISLTPYARAEHILSYEATSEPLERARRLLVRSHMGHGNNGTLTSNRNVWRIDGVTNTNDVAGQWRHFPSALRAWMERLRGVQLEQRPAIDLICKFDVPHALIYCDPPYLPETRSASVRWETGKCCYAHEMTAAEHVTFLAHMIAAKAMVIVSGYPSPLYDTALQGWRRLELKARAHGNKQRVEVLWLNQVAVDGCGGLFP